MRLTIAITWTVLITLAVGCSAAADGPAEPGETETLPGADSRALDVFLVGGQSNASGEGDSALSVRVPQDQGFEWNPVSRTLTDGNDPIGNARTGSAWPAFLKRWYELTGRRAVVVAAAKGGSAQSYLATKNNDNWDDPVHGGVLYGVALSRLDGALAGLKAQGYTPVFRGVLWDQGGRDARAIKAGVMSIADYRTAFQAMIGRFRARYGPSTAMWVVRLGREATEDPVEWQQVRAVQDDVAARDPYTWIVFENAVNFPAEGKMKDDVHYNQAGYNEIGRVAAERVAAALFGGTP